MRLTPFFLAREKKISRGTCFSRKLYRVKNPTLRRNTPTSQIHECRNVSDDQIWKAKQHPKKYRYGNVRAKQHNRSSCCVLSFLSEVILFSREGGGEESCSQVIELFTLDFGVTSVYTDVNTVQYLCIINLDNDHNDLYLTTEDTTKARERKRRVCSPR